MHVFLKALQDNAEQHGTGKETFNVFFFFFFFLPYKTTNEKKEKGLRLVRNH